MKRSSIKNTALTLGLVLLVVLVSAPAVLAIDTGIIVPTRPTIDCADSSNQICFECCPNFKCADPTTKIACCQNDCDINNQPPAKPVVPAIHLDLSAGGASLTFERTLRTVGNSGREFIVVKIQQIFDPTVSIQALSVKTRLIGPDAPVGSMLYAVAFLAMGEQALDALHEHGYDVSFLGDAPSHTCQGLFPAETCTSMANQLSQGIYASLAIGASAERDAFLQGVQALGLAPCPIILY